MSHGPASRLSRLPPTPFSNQKLAGFRADKVLREIGTHKLECTLMTELQQHSQLVREALRCAVARALETKRRLGQYAVVYQDGKVVYILGNDSMTIVEVRV